VDDTALTHALRRTFRRAAASLRTGNPAEAERRLDALTREAPEFPDGWYLRAIAAHRIDRPETARQAFERARALAPERADIALDYGRFLLDTDAPEAGLLALEAAGEAPEYAEAAALGTAEALMTLGRREQAERHLGSFLEAHPEASDTRLRLLEILESTGQDARALALLEETVRERPGDVGLAVQLAVRLRGAGRPAEADALSRRLTAMPGSPPDAWLELAVAAAQRGERDAAIECAAETLRRDPFSGDACLILADLAEKPPDAAVAAVKRSGDRDPRMAFAKAHLLDRAGRHDEAWQAYADANRLTELTEGRYSADNQAHYTAGLIRHLDAEFVRRALDGNATGTPVPVFICGVSRSGTTLLEQMLASHPSGDVGAGGEMRTIHALLRRELGTPGLRETGAGLAALPAERLARLAKEWREAVHTAGPGHWVTDKMPSNTFLLGLVHVAFPESPIVLVERDPVALACSCFVTPFSEGHYFSRRLETIAHYFGQFRQIARHWESVLPPGRILHVRYEDILDDPASALLPLLEQLGLAWDDAMLAFHQRSEPITTASLVQVRRPLDRSAQQRWRRFEPWLAPWRERLEAAYWRGETAPMPRDGEPGTSSCA